jgi:hydrogenase nickel incorporation protein HypA/HybF
MHEMSLAINIIDLAVEITAREGGCRVSEVEIEVGSLAGVMGESLAFCLEAASRATIVAGADFRLFSVKARGECAACQSNFEVDSFYSGCPRCGTIGVKISGGQELKIKALTIEE